MHIDPAPFRRQRFGGIVQRRDWQYPVLLSVVLIAVVATTLLWRYQPGAIDSTAGEVATQTVKANRTVQYVSLIKTNEARRAAIEDPANIVMRAGPARPETQAQKLEDIPHGGGECEARSDARPHAVPRPRDARRARPACPPTISIPSSGSMTPRGCGWRMPRGRRCARR